MCASACHPRPGKPQRPSASVAQTSDGHTHISGFGPKPTPLFARLASGAFCLMPGGVVVCLGGLATLLMLLEQARFMKARNQVFHVETKLRYEDSLQNQLQSFDGAPHPFRPHCTPALIFIPMR